MFDSNDAGQNRFQPISTLFSRRIHSAALFEELANDYFLASYRSSPTSATDLGLHEYDHLLDDLTESALRARAEELRVFRRQFLALENQLSDLAAETDRLLILGEIDAELLSLQEIRDWERDPAYYVADPLFAIFLVASRDYAPLAERLPNLISRLDQVPDLLASARQNLKNPPGVLTEIAIEETEGAIEFCSTLIPTLAKQLPRVPRKLVEAASRASRALYEYLDFLRDELVLVSIGQAGLGFTHYQALLRAEYQLPYTINEILARGQRVFDETLTEMEEWARQIDPAKTWRELVNEARTAHPARNQLLAAYRAEINRLRRFVHERDLVTLPDEDCLVIETPPFERTLNSHAAYVAPGPFEQDQRGQFWVTPVDTTAPAAEQAEQLAEHCNFVYPVTTAHESYPGHHVQLVRANHTGSRWRRHFSSSLFAEGWALYCEELMNEAGYYRDPRMRLFQLKDRLWRAARVLLEIGLHCYDLSLEDAARFLVDKVNVTHTAARAETRRYIAEPGQPMSYLIGELEVLRLRDKFNHLSLREFHDLLLDSGTIPFALVEREMEQKVETKV